jgi:hypothetical protein
MLARRQVCLHIVLMSGQMRFEKSRIRKNLADNVVTDLQGDGYGRSGREFARFGE